MPNWNSQKIKVNKWIPFKGYSVINIFGVLYTKGNLKIRERTLRHEYIHTLQMREMWYVLFYIWYWIEWLLRVVIYGVRFIGRYFRDTNRKVNLHLAYRKISFEKEAFNNQDSISYSINRKKFSWVKHL